MVGFEEVGGEGFLLTHSSHDPIVLELNRLQNLLKEKDRELGFAQSEIKALKVAEVLKEKAVEELRNTVEKMDEKIRATENLLEQKNLDIKKQTDEKREALAAQFAAEATLRRVHASQRDDDSVLIESVIAPFEADIKMYKNEIAVLQEDKKSLERLTKSKETALLEAERILRSALERALVVEEVQNLNLELRRQIEICQEENKILEKTNRQKVLEVEKLSETIQELEEAILAGGAAANAIRDYHRQISELQEERKTLERELARAKVSANRVATTVANEWKDENDKVMPIKQWLDERRFLQAEMQRLKDKLAMSERTSKSDAQLKDKLKLRLKTLEDGLKHMYNSGSPKQQRSNHFFGILSSSAGKKRSTSQPRVSTVSSQKPTEENEQTNGMGELKRANSLRKKYASGESLLRKGLWASRSRVVDRDEKENAEMMENSTTNIHKLKDNESTSSAEMKISDGGNEEPKDDTISNSMTDDTVSGFLYDRLQKEVISLRKFCEMKDNSLKAKDEENKMLIKKVDILIKALEVESKKIKRESAVREKDPTYIKVDVDAKAFKNFNSSNRSSTPQKLPLLKRG